MASKSASRSGSKVDSYIGSLISLTSKSEIRYEGILYKVNGEESNICLRNVRSFGTEGRKKDGPQIPPGDKVYEYIIFRRAGVKDLQVKSSPPVHPTPQVNNDTAIIQSHSVTISTSLPSAMSGYLTDLNSHTVQLGLPWSTFQGPQCASWGVSPPVPNVNGDELAMPMDWQGYYGSPKGLPQLSPSVTSDSLPLSCLLPAPSALPPAPSATLASEVLPVTVIEKAPNVSTATVALAPSLPSLTPLTDSGPDINALVSPISSKPKVVSGSSLPYKVVSELSPAAPTLDSSAQPSQTPHKKDEVVHVSSTSSAEPSLPVSAETKPPMLPLPVTSGPSHRTGVAPIQTHHGYGYRGHGRGRGRGIRVWRPVTRFTEDFNFMAMNEKFKKDEVWGHLGKSNKSDSKDKDEEENTFDEDYTQDEDYDELSNVEVKLGEAPIQTHHGYGYKGRGRGRGIRVWRPVTRFTEDFNFMEMNEKFKKDEVWGHLGKSNKSDSKDKDGEQNTFDKDYSQDEDYGNLSNVEVKPVHNNDKFFDSPSSSVHVYSQNGRTTYSDQIKIDTKTFGDFARYCGGRCGRGGQTGGGYYGRGGVYGNYGRTTYSERIKIDTETFGDFARHCGGRWGRGPGRGGRTRGGYYGRGRVYGYYGSERGRGMPDHCS